MSQTVGTENKDEKIESGCSCQGSTKFYKCCSKIPNSLTTNISWQNSWQSQYSMDVDELKI